MRLNLALIALAALSLSACTDKNYNPLNNYLSKRSIALPTDTSFQSCRGYGCQYSDDITFTDKQWREIDQLFRADIKIAKQEREAIALSIAKFEDFVGQHTGTSEDVWGTFQKTGNKQQDCVDESINTSIYVRVLKHRGHIKFHTVETPQSRIPFLRWPHQTAVLKEIETQKTYAIDSWFHNNGEIPEVIDLKTWKSGWKPEGHDTPNDQQGDQ